jgi:hypothetical protein
MRATEPQNGTSTLLDQVIGSPQLEVRIDVRICSRVSIYVIGECLVKIVWLLLCSRSAGIPQTPQLQRRDRAAVLDFVDEFLLPRNRKHCERCSTATRTRRISGFVG